MRAQENKKFDLCINSGMLYTTSAARIKLYQKSVFCKIREIYGMSQNTDTDWKGFIHSFTMEKTRSPFYVSRGKTVIVKEIRKHEKEVLFLHVSDYLEHIEQTCRETTICPLYAMFKYNSRYYIAMKNITGELGFDLKGNLARTRRCEQDFIAFKMCDVTRGRLGMSCRMRQILKSDLRFLAAHHIVDYSVYVTIDYNGKIDIAVIDILTKYSLSKLLERGIKKCLCYGEVSALPPLSYEKRLLRFLDEHLPVFAVPPPADAL